MKFKHYKMSSLNEALLKTPVTACDDDDLEVVVAADPTYADALIQSKKTQKAIDDRFKDFNANMKEFAEDNQNREKEGKAKMELKKLHLSEGLFEDIKVESPAVDEEDIVVKTTEPKSEPLTEKKIKPLTPDGLSNVEDPFDKLRAHDDAKGGFAMSRLKDMTSEAISYAIKRGEDPEAVREAVMKILADALDNEVTEDVDPDFFEDTDELVEAPVDVDETKKKRTRGENEKKERRDYSSEDLWLAVYDDLCATVDNEGEGQQVHKQVKARKGERYEHVYPHGDTDLIVYAQSPEKFEFAKTVADHYGVEYDEPKEDTNKNTNNYYKYSMVIHIPEDGLYSED